jgi:hypothetical protein
MKSVLLVASFAQMHVTREREGYRKRERERERERE